MIKTNLLCGVFLFAFFMPAAYASHHSIFVGEFENVSHTADADGDQPHDVSVNIREIDQGLNISWEATVFDDGNAQTNKFSIDFLETEREHIYKAAQKKNLFGGRDPLDPMKGEPYAWARIDDKTLTVFVMIVADDGDFEIQTYNRTLTPDGNLTSEFSRIRKGELVRSAKTMLTARTPARPEKNK